MEQGKEYRINNSIIIFEKCDYGAVGLDRIITHAKSLKMLKCEEVEVASLAV